MNDEVFDVFILSDVFELSNVFDVCEGPTDDGIISVGLIVMSSEVAGSGLG